MPAQWTVQEAKDKFSEIVHAARMGQPQFIQQEGQEEVVLVSAQKWSEKKMEMPKQGDNTGLETPQRNFIDFLLSAPKGDWDFEPDRGALKLRDVEF